MMVLALLLIDDDSDCDDNSDYDYENDYGVLTMLTSSSQLS